MSRIQTTPSGRRFYSVPDHGFTVRLPRHVYTTAHYYLSVSASRGAGRFGVVEDFLIDSGADLCVVDREYATRHGFEVNSGDPHRMQGLGPEFDGVVVYRDVRLPDFDDMPLRLTFWVPDQVGLGNFRLLSLTGLLAYFSIMFHQGRADFYLPP